jgi:hypothetical protein
MTKRNIVKGEKKIDAVLEKDLAILPFPSFSTPLPSAQLLPSNEEYEYFIERNRNDSKSTSTEQIIFEDKISTLNSQPCSLVVAKETPVVKEIDNFVCSTLKPSQLYTKLFGVQSTGIFDGGIANFYQFFRSNYFIYQIELVSKKFSDDFLFKKRLLWICPSTKSIHWYLNFVYLFRITIS